MKYFIVTDVHGHYKEFIEALDKAGFDMYNENHHLISLGDNFDRGTENMKMLLFLHKLLKMGKLTPILGNHDEFFFYPNNYVFNATYNGLDETLSEFYDGIPKTPEDLFKKLPELKELLDAMESFVEIGNYVFLHSGLDLDGFPVIWADTRQWLSSGISDDNGKTYVFGHWHAFDLNRIFLGQTRREAAKKNRPFIYKNYIGLDSAVALTKEIFIHTVEL